MSALKLKTVTRTQGNNQALKNGSVKVRGLDLDFEEVPLLTDAFRRMVRELEFDICELPLTTYLCARAHGKRFTALPIFGVRAFHHGAVLVNNDAGIEHPRDLEGRRVGVNRGWTVTSGFWARSVLQHQYGVDLNKISWVLSGDEHVAEYQLPAGIETLEKGRNIADMVISGELAGAIGVEINSEKVRPLIADAPQAGLAALRDHGHYPINHLLVVKDELLQTQPWIGSAIFEAFAEAKRCYVAQLKSAAIVRPNPVDDLHRQVMAITGADPLPYGIEPNRRVLEQAISAAVEQRIILRAPRLEELFPGNTLALTG
jgi:4,5-dihydroxyphthalate decarboxylase